MDEQNLDGDHHFVILLPQTAIARQSLLCPHHSGSLERGLALGSAGESPGSVGNGLFVRLIVSTDHSSFGTEFLTVLNHTFALFLALDRTRENLTTFTGFTPQN